MPPQYALRFESGERRGELVPLAGALGPGQAFTIGRKPGNALQVTDPSVSGRHAELELAAGRIRLRDLGSTNGTHVGGARVQETQLEHGDEFMLGGVSFLVLDRALADDGPAADAGLVLEDPAPGLGETRIQPRDESLEISAADLARSRRTSKLGPLAVIGLAVVAAGVLFWTRSAGADGGGDRPVRGAAIEAPAGDLLGGSYSFEAASGEGWAPGEAGAATFSITSAAARTGRRGFRADLRPGDLAVQVSDPVQVSGGLRLVGAVRTEGRAVGRLGVELEYEDGTQATVWSADASGGDFRDLELDVAVPSTVRTARAVLEARSLESPPEGGVEVEANAAVDIDDVALVPTDAGADPVHSEGTFRTFAVGGSGGRTTALAIEWRGDPYAPLVRVRDAAGAPVGVDVRTDGADLLLTPAMDGRLELAVAVDLAAARVATLGARDAEGHAGYADHGLQFESPDAAGLLVGDDPSLLYVLFADGRTIEGREAGSVARFAAPVRGGETFALVFAFPDERTLAERLARRARQERSEGRPGAAYATWDQLLLEAPFTAGLVADAQVGQSEIVAEGRQHWRTLTDEVERARFFGLGDLYREKLARAGELEATYAGSDAATLAAELADTIRAELRALEGDTGGDERARLRAIGAALVKDGDTALADVVEGYAESLGTTDGTSEGDDR